MADKPLNKEIKFAYSDSSDNEGDDESEDEDHESERLAEGDKDNESKVSVDDKNSDDGKKGDQPQEDQCEQIDNKEVDKQQVHGESKGNEEPPAKKQCGDANKLENENHTLDKTEKSVDKLIEAELRELTDKGKVSTHIFGLVLVQLDTKAVSVIVRLLFGRMYRSSGNNVDSQSEGRSTGPSTSNSQVN